MILVIVAFLVGGVLERYVCQTTQSPYELLQASTVRELRYSLFTLERYYAERQRGDVFRRFVCYIL